MTRDKVPAIIYSEAGHLHCYIGREAVDPYQAWFKIFRQPITAKYFVGSGGYDPRDHEAPASDKISSDSIPDLKTFDDLLPYISEFVASAQYWCSNQEGAQDRETALKAGVILKKSRSLYSLLVNFKSQASDKQYQQMGEQLKNVGESCKHIIKPWIDANNDEIAGINKNNTRLAKERYAKIEDLDACLLHYKTHKEILQILQRFADADARSNKKIPGVKVLIREVSRA